MDTDPERLAVAARRSAGAGTVAKQRGGQARARALRALESAARRDDFARALRASFEVDGSSDVLLTGYFEPVLDVRTQRSPTHRHPIFALPSGDLRTLSRADIRRGGLRGRGLELFWATDPVEVFFLHVQGSGRLRKPDGSVVRIGYAGNNGREYTSIGKVLLRRGAFAHAREVTAPAIKEYLRRHPGLVDEILDQNERYIFFREVAVARGAGPVGSMGVPLVDMHSVAADPKVAPAGRVGILHARLPDGRPLRTVVIVMDTGAAIQGEKRLDLFVGTGTAAGRIAGELRSRGRITWLRLRDSR